MSRCCHSGAYVMATIRKRGSSWQVQVRRTGFPVLSRSFPSKQAATVWARKMDRQVDLGCDLAEYSRLKAITLSDLLQRYLQEITSTKRGVVQESVQIAVICRTWLGRLSLADISPVTMAIFRDERLKVVRPATARRDLAVLSHCFEIARKEWGIRLPNPVREIRLPQPSRGRDRRLSSLEMACLDAALIKSRAAYLRPMVQLAMETGVRRGELLSLRWVNLDWNTRTAILPLTKNGAERRVPLTRHALNVLLAIERNGDFVFAVKPGTVRQAWDWAARKAGTPDLRFHDLRHEAISRFFELGLSIPEVALISGHRDVRMLFRYTHLRPEAVLAKIEKLQEPARVLAVSP